MIQNIFNFLIKLIVGVANVILYPFNALFNTLIPDVGTYLTLFAQNVNTYIGAGLGWFSHMLPPTTQQLILVYLIFLGTYYTISFSIRAITKVFDVIQRIKFW